MESRRRDFVIFFEQKEGTTAIVRLLNAFPEVGVIRTRGAWEPFNPHVCGAISSEAIRECFELIFSHAPAAEVNRIYRSMAGRSLSRYDLDASLGFKIRDTELPEPAEIFKVLRDHAVVVFIAVRQNLLRWALSKYHGDGTGRPGHLQFQLASGQIERREIPRMRVDEDGLAEVIRRCERLHAEKRELAATLRGQGLEVLPLRYEAFLRDKRAFFVELLEHLGHSATDDDVTAALEHDIRLQRVHGDDLSEFFVNASELEARFGDRLVAWP